MMVNMTTMPETPRWLVKNKRIQDGIRVLQQPRSGSTNKAEQECGHIANTLGEFFFQL